MTSVRTVLVVGGGNSGLTLATLLARAGVSIEIVERNLQFVVLGSGITLQGPAARVLQEVGVLDELRRHGYEFTGLRLRSVDGRALADLPSAPTLGAYRPKMTELLAAAATEAGVTLRLGASVTSFTQDGDGVDVVFSDGDTARYDLVVGADGVRSTTRRQLGINAEPRPTGLGVFRVVARRPTDVATSELCYDGPCYIAGCTPTGPDSLYAFLVEAARDRSDHTPAQIVAAMRELAEPYHGPWDEIREDITDGARINYTWFEHLLIDGPWNRGRVVLIGDAAHTCPPTIAQGGAMALEDAVVLAELLVDGTALDQGVWDAFHARRYDRAKTVVDASNTLAQWQLDHVQGDIPGLMRSIAMLTSQPA